MVKDYVPERGDLVWMNLNPVVGHEQAHERPVLVLTMQKYNRQSGLLVACPITSKEKGYIFEIPVTGKKVQGVILTDQVRSVDWKQRSVRFIERVPETILSDVLDNVHALLFPTK